MNDSTIQYITCHHKMLKDTETLYMFIKKCNHVHIFLFCITCKKDMCSIKQYPPTLEITKSMIFRKQEIKAVPSGTRILQTTFSKNPNLLNQSTTTMDVSTLLDYKISNVDYSFVHQETSCPPP